MADATRIALVTVAGVAVAERMVRTLVEERVVACGNILPGITSIFRWQGAVEREQETLIVFKTTAQGATRLLQRVPELHPYDVPEVLVIPVEAGHPPYMNWVNENVGEGER